MISAHAAFGINAEIGGVETLLSNEPFTSHLSGGGPVRTAKIVSALVMRFPETMGRQAGRLSCSLFFPNRQLLTRQASLSYLRGASSSNGGRGRNITA
jgi:hypothetical protein